MKRHSRRIVAWLLVLVLTISLVSGCGTTGSGIVEPMTVVMPTVTTTHQENSLTPTQQLAASVTPMLSDSISKRLKQEKELFSMNPAAFVLTLLKEELKSKYECFDALIEVDDTCVPGIAYTDYASYFTTENKSKGFFPAGFIAFEDYANKSQSSGGIEISNLNYSDEKCSFVLAYDSYQLKRHCVINGQYVTYDVDSKGVMSYATTPFSREKCDESRGALYSYDEGRYLYDPNVGEFKGITGESLSTQLVFSKLEEEINRILEEQDASFVSVDSKTCFAIAQEAVKSYLLSMQQETFLGYSVEELVREAEQLEPDQCFRLSENGVEIIDIQPLPSAGVGVTAKWLIASASAVVIVGTTVLSFFAPASALIAEELSDIALEVFLQVVKDNASLKDIEWGKIAVSTVMSAAFSFLCPLDEKLADWVEKVTDNKAFRKIAKYAYEAGKESLIDGVTEAVFAIAECRDDAFDAFKSGAVIGAVMTVVGNVADDVGSVVAEKILKKEPNIWLRTAMSVGKSYIMGHLVDVTTQQAEDIIIPQVRYLAGITAKSELAEQLFSRGKELAGGRYYDVQQFCVAGYKTARAIPSYSITGDYSPLVNPAVLMDISDYILTTGWGSSTEAQEYRTMLAEMWKQGKTKEVIDMEVQDLRAKFDSKYETGIRKLLDYATEIGWYQ